MRPVYDLFSLLTSTHCNHLLLVFSSDRPLLDHDVGVSQTCPNGRVCLLGGDECSGNSGRKVQVCPAGSD